MVMVGKRVGGAWKAKENSTFGFTWSGRFGLNRGTGVGDGGGGKPCWSFGVCLDVPVGASAGCFPAPTTCKRCAVPLRSGTWVQGRG